MNQSTLPPLPILWITKIFERFNAVYGPALMRGTWGDEDLTEVWQVWADDLKTFRDHPGAIKYALENLPADYPPNLIQFKEICRDGLRRAQQQQHAALPHKLTDEEKAANRENIERIKAMISRSVVSNW